MLLAKSLPFSLTELEKSFRIFCMVKLMDGRILMNGKIVRFYSISLVNAHKINIGRNGSYLTWLATS